MPAYKKNINLRDELYQFVDCILLSILLSMRILI